MADLGVPAHAGEVSPGDEGVFNYPAGPPAQIVADATNAEDWARAGG
ncbi:MAG: hypothetical protein L0H64_00780 [Pseudonocardia sp.]|nr:hypothetical protein [Pseudonocardia sp.]